MILICEQFATDFDIKFNSDKTVVIRVGPRLDMACVQLTLYYVNLNFVEELKYLGDFIRAGKMF